ncbi:hypothetical protein BN8_01819 [Fibrisoma limi BUZ 3]|uniref:Uncharacterized protein n=1 Tax=Fibrisoma limi BUZ 3 TaxID=1185876 RepID=I2GFW6_9BACT|nr:hypothetical protein BN8_01819 [Fibrisoma limi BUZ 3]
MVNASVMRTVKNGLLIGGMDQLLVIVREITL